MILKSNIPLFIDGDEIDDIIETQSYKGVEQKRAENNT